MTEQIRLRISKLTLGLYADRLYGHDDSTDTVLVHQDRVGATFTIIKYTSTMTVVDMSAEAVADFLDDCDYQVECNTLDDDEGMTSLTKACERAAASVRKQIKQVA